MQFPDVKNSPTFFYGCFSYTLNNQNCFWDLGTGSIYLYLKLNNFDYEYYSELDDRETKKLYIEDRVTTSEFKDFQQRITNFCLGRDLQTQNPSTDDFVKVRGFLKITNCDNFVCECDIFVNNDTQQMVLFAAEKSWVSDPRNYLLTTKLNNDEFKTFLGTLEVSRSLDMFDNKRNL